MAWPIHCALGLVPSTWPAWKSFITSPASPHATATMPATKKSCTCGTLDTAATAKSTMRPNISMGSMPVWPTLCALMAVATKASSTTMTAGTGPSCRPKQTMSATAATASAASPAVRRKLPMRSRPSLAPLAGASMVLAAVRPNAFELRASRSMRQALGRMFLKMTPRPAPIMTPIPRLDTMPCADATSQSPAAEPPTMMPKFASSAPTNHTTTAPVPTRKPTARSIGDR